MPVEIIECEQNSEEWYLARRGLPTASMFSAILANGRGGAPSKTRHTYMTKLAGEIVSGQPMDNYTNHHMDRGHAMEDQARKAYAFMTDNDPKRVGFVKNGRAGCSPDSLIGDSGLLEIKSQAPHILIDTILKDRIPPEHMAQCQGQLWLTEREWLDFTAFWPDMPPFIKRMHRDAKYIATLKQEVARFNEELDEMVERIRAYKWSAAA